MRFLLDQNIPPAMVGWLAEMGADAIHVRERGLASADDGAVLAFAIQEGLTIVSKDADFKRLTRRDGPKVVWLKIGNARNAEFKIWLVLRWPWVLRQLEMGEPLIEID